MYSYACTSADLIVFMPDKKLVTRNFMTTYFIIKPLLQNTFPIKCLVMSSAARNKHKFGTNQR